MKNLYSIFCFLFILDAIAYTQVPIPELNINGQNYSSGNTTIIHASCINVANTVISNTAKVNIISGECIKLKTGFQAINFSGNGYFHAYIEPNPFEVVIMEPITNPGNVGKFEKFELGIKLPDNINNAINSYFASNSGINPFDPVQISIEATFISPSNNQYNIYGFYYKDYQRLYKNNVAYNWSEVSTDYPWRIRFAPTEAGSWKCNIKCTYGNNNTVLNYPEFSFNCQDNSNKGYLKFNSYNQLLTFSDNNSTFFAIGDNIPWGGTCSSSDWWYHVLADDYDSVYAPRFAQLQSVGGNYVRHWMCRWSHGIEWEKLNDYSTNDIYQTNEQCNRQITAWELDKIFELAKNDNIYIQLTLDAAAEYTDEWNDNPYSKLPNVDSPDKFFSDAIAKNIYKNRLRYIIARWGYSTNLAAYELMNEIDQITPYSTSSQFQSTVSQWSSEMANYIKNILGDKNHLISLSYAGYPLGPDYSFSNSNIDFCDGHRYGDDKTRNYFYWYQDGINGHLDNYQKPYLIGEIGPYINRFNADICSDVTTHNNLWATTFMGGFGTGLYWADDIFHFYSNNYKNLRAVSDFFQGEDLVNYQWEQVFDKNTANSHPVGIEFFLMERSDKFRVLGWMHQQSYYWGVLGNEFPCLQAYGANNSGPTDVDDDAKLFLTDDYTWFKKYDIDIYKLEHDDMGAVYSWHTDKKVNVWGQLKIKVGSYFGNSADLHDFGFKLYRSSNKSSDNEILIDTLDCPNDTIFVEGNYEDDIKGKYSYYWNFGNGQISNEWHPKVYYERPGNYMVTLIINDNKGNIDTLKQLEVVPYCDSLNQDTSGKFKSINPQYTSNFGNFIQNSFLKVIPNPNNGNMNVLYEIPDKEAGTFILYDLTGRPLMSYNLFGGKNSFAINGTSLANGVYLYKAIAGNKILGGDKIVIIK